MHGEFEPGKIDNAFSTFSAGGRQWMALTLELWARIAAVDWAKTVVASHPDYNVIVATHSYLDADGSILSDQRRIRRQLTAVLVRQPDSPVSNIRLVFSGRTGIAGSRLDTGGGGNSIASFLGTFHSATTNPIQIVDIDTASNTEYGEYAFYAPFTQTEFPNTVGRCSA
jgi:hypothetical protein